VVARPTTPAGAADPVGNRRLGLDIGPEPREVGRRDPEGAAVLDRRQFTAGDGPAHGALGDAKPDRRLAGGEDRPLLVRVACPRPVRRVHHDGVIIDPGGGRRQPRRGRGWIAPGVVGRNLPAPVR
jgi:hypothetical protein